MPSLVATTSALARTMCVRTHYVRTNYTPSYIATVSYILQDLKRRINGSDHNLEYNGIKPTSGCILTFWLMSGCTQNYLAAHQTIWLHTNLFGCTSTCLAAHQPFWLHTNLSDLHITLYAHFM